MSEEKVNRRRFLNYGITAVVCGVVAGVGGYYGGLLSVPPGEVTTSTSTTRITEPGPAVTTTVTAPPVTTTMTRTTTQVAPTEPIIFVWLSAQQIQNVDPAIGTDLTSNVIINNMYDPLFVPAGSYGGLTSHVATSLSVSSDGLTYKVRLRPNVKFHNGDEVTADDVKFSMERALAIKKGNAWMWLGVIESIEALDKYTVEFRLSSPYSPFPATLVSLLVVNKEEVLAHKQSGDFGDMGDYGQSWLMKHDAGSGPFILKSIEPRSEAVLERFSDYWGGWRPKQIDTLVVRVVLEVATQKLLLTKGEAHMSYTLLPKEFFDDMRNVGGISVKTDPSWLNYITLMNNQKPPLDNVHVRRAISYALDYDVITEQIAPGERTGPVPKFVEGHNPQAKPYSRDVAKAKEEFAMSGYKPGEIKLTQVYAAGAEGSKRVGLLLQSNLRDLGIDVEIREETWVRITELATKSDTTPDMVTIWAPAFYPSLDAWLYSYYSRHAWGNWQSQSWYDSDTVTDLIDEARLTVDAGKRTEIYNKIQEMVVQDAPILWLCNTYTQVALQDYVKGYEWRGLDIWFLFHDYTIEK